MKRTIPPLLTVAVIAAGCGSVTTESSGDDGDSVTVESCGREVTVTAVPERVVSMHPSLTELMVQLGLGDRVVAQAQDALGEPSPELAEEVQAITSISADSPPTREDLLAQDPDFVISGTEYEFSTDQGFAGYDALEQAGAPAYVATAGCIDRRSEGTVADTLADVENLGRIFDVSDRADELIAQAEQDLAEIDEIVGDDEPVRAVQVYVEGGKLYAIGGAVEIDVLRLGGGENLFAGDSRFDDFFAAEVNPEVVVDLQPDAFVFAVNDAAHEQETRAYLERTLAETPAVQNGLLVAVDNTYVQPGTLSGITGARLVAEALHG